MSHSLIEKLWESIVDVFFRFGTPYFAFKFLSNNIQKWFTNKKNSLWIQADKWFVVPKRNELNVLIHTCIIIQSMKNISIQKGMPFHLSMHTFSLMWNVIESRSLCYLITLQQISFEKDFRLCYKCFFNWTKIFDLKTNSEFLYFKWFESHFNLNFKLVCLQENIRSL